MKKVLLYFLIVSSFILISVSVFSQQSYQLGDANTDGTILDYLWNFGDGSKGVGERITHQYSNGGEYEVSLTVTDNDSLVGIKTETMVVYTGAPVADFSFIPEWPEPGAHVNFNGSSSFDVYGSITSYSWDFGDGSSGTGRNTSHVFTKSAGFQVTLTVTDNEGRSGSTTCIVKTRPIIGVIRWDAWVGDLASYGQEIEKTLSPNHWHYRFPFYGVELGPNSVQARCLTQETVDAEIEYVKNGGIDYFAFLIYDDDSSNWGYELGIALRLYLKSSNKDDVKFSAIMPQKDQIQDQEQLPRWIDRFTDFFKDSAYQTVFGNRPLVYAFRWKGWSDGLNFLNQLKSACAGEGIPTPYFVDLHYETLPQSYGFDAMSGYTHNLGTQDGEHPFSDLTACAESRWNERLVIRQVPLATSGWDGRPHVETPV